VDTRKNLYYKIQSSNFPYFYVWVLVLLFMHCRVCSVGDGWTASSNTNSYWYYESSETQHGIKIYVLCSEMLPWFIDCPDPNLWLTRVKPSGQREAFRPSNGVYAGCDATDLSSFTLENFIILHSTIFVIFPHKFSAKVELLQFLC
jgi:hypothetical protein